MINLPEQLSQAQSLFEAQKYLVVKQAISKESAELTARYMRLMDDYHKPLLVLEKKYGSVGRYVDPLAESILEKLLPIVSENTGLTLLPTYSYIRLYKKGAELKKHLDRPSCEVSCTLFLSGDYNEGYDWPIYVEADGEERRIDLEPGDIMIYRGCEVPHWRKPFEGTESTHIFLHYVDANGPHSHLAFDGRDGYGAPPKAKAPPKL